VVEHSQVLSAPQTPLQQSELNWHVVSVCAHFWPHFRVLELQKSDSDVQQSLSVLQLSPLEEHGFSSIA